MDEISFKKVSVPGNCSECGLYEDCKTWKIPARHGVLNEDGTADIMFLGQAPGYYEDEQGRIFTGPSGKYVQEFLDRLDVSWVLDNSVKCYPGRSQSGGDNAPSPAQIALCSSFLWRNVETFNPKVIVCLGAVAMKAVLGAKAPKSLTKAPPLMEMDDGRWVMIVKHPANHVSGREDLTERYITAFTQAERIVKKELDGVPFEWDIVDNVDALWKALGEMRITNWSLDVEVAVSASNPQKISIYHPDSKLLSISVTFKIGDRPYRTVVAIHEALDKHSWRQLLKKRTLWAHNTKFDMNCLWQFFGFNPWKCVKRWDDTFLRFYLRDQSKMGNSLKNLAEIHLGAMPWAHEVWNVVDQKNKLIKENNRIRKKEGLPPLVADANFEDVLNEYPNMLCEYNARDTFYTHRLKEEILPTFSSDISPVALELSLRASYALSRVEHRGLPVCENSLDSLIAASEKKIEQLQNLLRHQGEVQRVEAGYNKIVPPGGELTAQPDVWTPAEPQYKQYTSELTYHQDWAKWKNTTRMAEFMPHPLNVKSWKFMESLAEVTQHHTGDMTPSGRLKFDADTLKKLAGINPKVADDDKTRAQWIYYYLYHIRQHRDMGSKFLSNLRAYAVDGRIHTSYRLGRVDVVGRAAGADLEGGATSGRLSSSNPNLQNIKQDKVLRSCFRAVPGTVLVESDYDRIELVVLAELSQDPLLLEHVAPGNDPHSRMGERIAKILKVNYDRSIHRELGKRANFGKVYGQSPEALARMALIPFRDALLIHEAYDGMYPKVLEYFASIEAKVRAGEMVETIWGRKRSGRITGHPGKDGHTIRSLQNFPIQGSANDICLWKLTEIIEYLESEYGEDENNWPFHPVNIIHDSHTNEVLISELTESLHIITEIMEDMSTLPIRFGSTLKVSHKKGYHLGAMEEIKL